MYKKELVVSFVSMLLIYLVSAGLTVKAQYTEDGKAFILASRISIISPSNITYSSNLLTLNVTFKLMLGINCTELSYSIDGKDNITITPTVSRQLIEATITYENGTTIIGNATFVPYIINGWAILPELAEGSHNITVYGRYNANNIIGLDNSTVYFTINSNPAQENWSEVARFTGDGAFFGSTLPSTGPFRIDYVDWRIRWEYEIAIPNLTAFLFEVKLADTDEIIDGYNNSGRLNIQEGILNITDYTGEFYIFIGTNAKSYTIIVEQNLDSIPENNLTLFGFLALGIIVLTIKLVHFRKEKNEKNKLAFTIFFILYLVIPTPLVLATDYNSWTTLAPLPESSSYTIGAVAVAGNIYHIGWSTCEKYDPETNNWTTIASIPVYSGGTVVAYQNKIYLIGGNPTQVYDPVTDSWENRTSIPTKRISLQANVVDSKIYLIGGRMPAGLYQIVPSSSNDVYDPATDSWSQMAPIPVPVMGYASAVLDNKIYIISGGNTHLEYLPTNLVQIFNPATNQWKNGTQIPMGVCYSRACVTTGLLAPKRIYVIGGTNTAYDRWAYYNVISLNQIFDPETDTWTTGSPILTPRCDFGIAVVDDEIYAIGGIREENYQMIVNEKYTPAGYIPEFPSWIILPLSVLATLTMIFIRNKIQRKG